MGVLKGDHHHKWYALAEQVANEYDSTDKSYSQIAEEFKLHRRTVKEMIAYYNIPPKERRRKYEINQSFFKLINNEITAYWLGFIAADGSLTNPDVFRIELARKDEEHLVKLLSALDSTHNIRRVEREFPSSSVSINSREIVYDLSKYGIVPNKSLTFDWPDNLEPLLYHHFIRGYTDGDGGFYDKPSYGVIATVPFASRLQSILIKECDLNETILKKSSTKEMVYLSYEGIHQVNRIFHYLYDDATIWLSRKRDLIEPILKERLRIIENKIERRTDIENKVCIRYSNGERSDYIYEDLKIGKTTMYRILRKHRLINY